MMDLLEDMTKQVNKTSQKLEAQVKELQEKLGKKSVPLSVLAEGIKDYAEEAGIDKAHELFNHLNTILIEVTAWTENIPELRKFFKKARRDMGKNTTNIAHQTLFSNVGTYNEKVDTQNNQFPALEGAKKIES